MGKPKFGAGRAGGLGIFDDPETDWAWKRAIAYMPQGAAALGECLAAARQVDEADGETWISSWASVAERVEIAADESLKVGQAASARYGYLRASNYWRTAEYAAAPDHPRFDELWRRSVSAFQAAGALFERPIAPVTIQVEGHDLPGYFCRASDTESRPTVVAVGGNDSSIEEIGLNAFGAVERGFNFFIFDHPGHRGAVHLHPELTKRSRYDDVYAVALDAVQEYPGVDGTFAMFGYSYGGYIVSQVATKEPRLAAVIPNSPIVNGRVALGGGFLKNVMAVVEANPTMTVDEVMEQWLAPSPVMRGLMHYSRWSWGYTTFAEQFGSTLLDEHNLETELGEITCPTLAAVSADEGDELVRQAHFYIEGVSSAEKRLHVFELDVDGAQDHCQIDNLARFQQVAYDWLASVLG